MVVAGLAPPRALSMVVAGLAPPRALSMVVAGLAPPRALRMVVAGLVPPRALRKRRGKPRDYRPGPHARTWLRPSPIVAVLTRRSGARLTTCVQGEERSLSIWSGSRSAIQVHPG